MKLRIKAKGNILVSVVIFMALLLGLCFTSFVLSSKNLQNANLEQNKAQAYLYAVCATDSIAEALLSDADCVRPIVQKLHALSVGEKTQIHTDIPNAQESDSCIITFTKKQEHTFLISSHVQYRTADGASSRTITLYPKRFLPGKAPLTLTGLSDSISVLAGFESNGEVFLDTRLVLMGEEEKETFIEGNVTISGSAVFIHSKLLSDVVSVGNDLVLHQGLEQTQQLLVGGNLYCFDGEENTVISADVVVFGDIFLLNQQNITIQGDLFLLGEVYQTAAGLPFSYHNGKPCTGFGNLVVEGNVYHKGNPSPLIFTTGSFVPIEAIFLTDFMIELESTISNPCWLGTKELDLPSLYVTFEKEEAENRFIAKITGSCVIEEIAFPSDEGVYTLYLDTSDVPPDKNGNRIMEIILKPNAHRQDDGNLSSSPDRNDIFSWKGTADNNSLFTIETQGDGIVVLKLADGVKEYFAGEHVQLGREESDAILLVESNAPVTWKFSPGSYTYASLYAPRSYVISEGIIMGSAVVSAWESKNEGKAVFVPFSWEAVLDIFTSEIQGQPKYWRRIYPFWDRRK